MKNYFIIFTILLILFPSCSYASESIEEMEDELSELKEQREDMKTELNELEKEAGIESDDEYDISPEVPKNFSLEQPKSENYKGKILEINKESKAIKIRFLNKDREGQEINIKNDLRGNPYSLDFKTGDNIFVNILQYGNQPEQYIIKDFYHLDWLFIWIGIFILLVLILGGKKGFLSLLSLGLSVALIFLVFLPLVKKGYNPVVLSLLISVAVTIIALIIITGFTRKTIVAISGTLGGIVVATLLVLLMGYLSRLTGIGSETNRTIAVSFQNLNFKYIFYSGVIIGALGAVMDVAVSIASSQKEIKEHNKDISKKKLIKSGLNVGRDVLGSMINTLIFAYIGTSLAMVLMFTEGEMSLLEILNLGFITEEITRSLVGTMGLIVTIPLTALFGGIIYNRQKIKKK